MTITEQWHELDKAFVTPVASGFQIDFGSEEKATAAPIATQPGLQLKTNASSSLVLLKLYQAFDLS